MQIDNKLILENSKGLVVLYVEDDEMLRSSTANIFSNYFKQVDIAVDGQDGYDKYMDYKNSSGEYYDLIISDINMPHINGLEMSELINKENFNQSIIFVTAHDESGYLHEAIKLGANGFLNKPLDNDQLRFVLYKTTQAIADRKGVEKHYRELEELNLQLSKTVLELQNKQSQIEKSSRILNTMIKKEQILNPKTQEKKDEVKMDNAENYDDQLEEFRKDDLYELRDIHDELDVAIIDILQDKEACSIDEDALERVITGFKRYASTISVYPFFNNLFTSLESLADVMAHNDLPDDYRSAISIFELLETFMYVLGRWMDELSTSELSAINKLDASIINDLNTIRSMWLNEFDDSVAAEEIEFF